MTNGSREVVVITGATAGVGRATAREFAKHGARIGLLARGSEGLGATQQEIELLGGEALPIETDVSNADQVEAAASRVEEKFGPIDIWVNNAMTSVFARFKDTSPEDFRRVTEVTYLGVVYGTMAALKRMTPRNRGTIVQVGSALAYRSIPLQAAYCGAKHAIRGFTDSIRSELLHDRSQVHLTMVQLPAVNTPQFDWVKNQLPERPQPVGKIFQPEVPARAIYWAAHQKRREVFVGFSAVKAILGNKLIPGLLDRYLARTAFKGQLTGQPRVENRPSNLWQAVPEDFGAHGRFDARARHWSPQFWLTAHRRELGLFACFLGAAAATVLGRARR